MLALSEAALLQSSTETFFRKANFWDGKGKNAPPVFQSEGVQYLHIKVGQPPLASSCICLQLALNLGATSCMKAAGVASPEGAKHTVRVTELTLLAPRLPPSHALQLGSSTHSSQLIQGYTLRYAVQVAGLFWVATTRENVSPSLVLELLQRFYWIARVGAPLPQ